MTKEKSEKTEKVSKRPYRRRKVKRKKGGGQEKEKEKRREKVRDVGYS